MKTITLAIIIALLGCKKDDGQRQIVMKVDRACEFDNLDDNKSATFQCKAGPVTLMVKSGQVINYQVYSNCSGTPKKEAHLVVKVVDGKKEKEVYNSTGILHQVNFRVD